MSAVTTVAVVMSAASAINAGFLLRVREWCETLQRPARLASV
jgi:hypothetical protein